MRVRLSFEHEQKLLYERKLRTMKRIDYVVLPKQSVFEYERIRELYPGCRFKMQSGVFDQNYDEAKRMISNPHENCMIKILIGTLRTLQIITWMHMLG